MWKIISETSWFSDELGWFIQAEDGVLTLYSHAGRGDPAWLVWFDVASGRPLGAYGSQEECLRKADEYIKTHPVEHELAIRALAV